MSPMHRRSILLLASPRDRGAVTAARALARTGWTVGAGCPDAVGGLLGASRAVERVHLVPRPRGDAADFITAIHQAHAEASAPGGYDLVIGAGDDWLSALSHYRDRLPIRVAHPPAEAVDRAGDKLLLARWAEESGLASPVTRPVEPAVLAQLTEEHFPVVVKNRRHWHEGQERTLRLETQVCSTRENMDEVLTSLDAEGDEPILQEHREGRLGALIGLVHEGRLIGRVQQASPRLWPTPAGASARACTVPVDPELAAATERLLARLGWEGLVELQFLIDDDGTHRLIDLNGRYFGSLALSERARPGLVDAWARQAAGLSVPALADGRVGVRYQWFPGDLRRALAERRGGLLADLTGTLYWGLRAQHSVLSFTDPGPALTLLCRGTRHGAEVGAEDSAEAGVPEADRSMSAP